MMLGKHIFLLILFLILFNVDNYKEDDINLSKNN